MTKMNQSSNTITIEHHAMLFALISREVVTRFGKDGQAAISKAVRAYGKQRGTRMRESARNENRPSDFSSYILYGELDFGKTNNHFQIRQRSPYVEICATRCAYNGTWRQNGLIEYGKLYCEEIDRSIMQGFSPGFHFEVSGTLTNDAPCCRFRYFDAHLNLFTMLTLFWRKLRIGNRFIRSWAYHTAELYNSLADPVTQEFGKPGREAIDAAMSSFVEQYGKDLTSSIRTLASSLKIRS